MAPRSISTALLFFFAACLKAKKKKKITRKENTLLLVKARKDNFVMTIYLNISTEITS